MKVWAIVHRETREILRDMEDQSLCVYTNEHTAVEYYKTKTSIISLPFEVDIIPMELARCV